jgi:hypothetical protein
LNCLENGHPAAKGAKVTLNTRKEHQIYET